jgi:hypothetical protein
VNSTKRLAIFTLLGVLFASCDLGPSVLTSDELDGLYRVQLSQKGVTLSNGASALVTEALDLRIEARQSAPDPAALELVLENSQGGEEARRVFVDQSFRSATLSPNTLIVSDILATLPPLLLPADLSDGYYILKLEAKDDAGARLFSSRRVLLVYRGPSFIPTISAHPGTALTEGAVLLRLRDLAGVPAEPWIRWLVDGQPVAEGYASAGMDRLVWRASRMPDLHSVTAAVYPFKPPLGVDFSPPLSARINVPVKAVALSATAWDEGLPYLSRLVLQDSYSLEEALADLPGSRLLGSSYPEASGLGFAYVLGEGDGIMVPAKALELDAVPGSFSVALSVAPFAGSPRLDKASGLLLRRMTEDGNELYALGLREGFPFYRINGIETEAATPLVNRSSILALSLSRMREGTSVSFYVDGKRQSLGFVAEAFGSFLSQGYALLGGQDAVRANYLRLASIAGPYPAFKASFGAEQGQAFIAASGFETPVLDAGLSVDGPYSITERGLYLSAASMLSFLAQYADGSGFVFSARMDRPAWRLNLDLNDGRGLRVLSDGRVLLLPGDEMLGTVAFANPLDVAISFNAQSSSLSAGGASVQLPASLRFASLPRLLAVDSALVVEHVSLKK